MFSANQPDVQTMKFHLVKKPVLVVFLTNPRQKVALARFLGFYAHKSNFQIGVIQLQLEWSMNARNLSTPIHTLLMPTFFGLNLGI